MEHVNNSAQLVYDDFISNNQNLAKDIVDWYQSGQLEIVIKLRNGERLAYDFSNHTYRYLRKFKKSEYGLPDFSEEEWSRGFANKLRKKMRIKGMSGKELAARSGVSEPRISQYLNGKTIPSAAAVARLAFALECSVSELSWFAELSL